MNRSIIHNHIKNLIFIAFYGGSLVIEYLKLFINIIPGFFILLNSTIFNSEVTFKYIFINKFWWLLVLLATANPLHSIVLLLWHVTLIMWTTLKLWFIYKHYNTPHFLFSIEHQIWIIFFIRWIFGETWKGIIEQRTNRKINMLLISM